MTAATLDDERGVAEVLAMLERSRALGPDGEPLALDRFHADHLAVERLDVGLCVLACRRQQTVGAAICESCAWAWSSETSGFNRAMAWTPPRARAPVRG